MEKSVEYKTDIGALREGVPELIAQGNMFIILSDGKSAVSVESINVSWLVLKACYLALKAILKVLISIEAKLG